MFAQLGVSTWTFEDHEEKLEFDFVYKEQVTYFCDGRVELKLWFQVQSESFKRLLSKERIRKFTLYRNRTVREMASGEDVTNVEVFSNISVPKIQETCQLDEIADLVVEAVIK